MNVRLRIDSEENQNLFPTETLETQRVVVFAKGLGGSLLVTEALCPSDTIGKHRHTQSVIIHCVLNTPRHTKFYDHNGGGGVQPGAEGGEI